MSIKCPMSMLPPPYDVIASDDTNDRGQRTVEPRVEFAVIQLGSFKRNELLSKLMLTRRKRGDVHHVCSAILVLPLLSLQRRVRLWSHAQII